MIRESATRSGRGFSRRLDVASRVQSRESLYAPSVSSPRPDQQFDPRRSRSQPTHSATKWPVTLELSGKKIHEQNGRHSLSAAQDNETKSGERETTTTDITEIAGNVENVDKTVSDSQKGILSHLPPLSQSLVRQSATPSANAKKMSFSPTFYADYGLRCEKTDTFPGLLHRRKREKSNVEIVKQIEQKANRHIYACQVLSNSKRGSKAAQSVNTLKQTVGPKRASTSQLPTTFVRQHLHHAPERQATFVDVSKRAPFSLFIRTRESPDFSRAPRHKTAPLPEINGRTLILGFDTKHWRILKGYYGEISSLPSALLMGYWYFVITWVINLCQDSLTVRIHCAELFTYSKYIIFMRPILSHKQIYVYNYTMFVKLN